MDGKIFAGSSHREFAEKVAKKCGQKLGKIEIRKFSCGEIYLKFNESFRGQKIFLVQTGRTEKMNEDLMELFLMIDAARQSFAEKIHVLMPYFPYSRQDKIHGPREGISAKLFAKLLRTAGADHMISLHFHSDQIQGFFDFPVDNLNSRKIFVEYFLKKNLQNLVVVSPDAGGAKSAKKFADELNCEIAILHKNRPSHNCAEILEIIGNVENKTPIIFDDMIDTAGSVCAAKKILVEKGAREKIFLCATHPIFSGRAREKLSAANFAEIVCTDSLPVADPPQNFRTLSIADLFAKTIKNIAENKSVSNLFF